MTLADPTLKDRELAGIGGMLLWGPPSSVVLILAPLFLSPALSDPASYPWSILPALILYVGAGLIIAVPVWGIGGTFVALPIWSVLVAVGLRKRRLRLAMIGMGAVIVGGIWAWFIHAPAASFGFWLALGLGAVSGALGGHGFCRSAMRS